LQNKERTQKIEELQEKLSSSKEERKKANAETNKWAEKRNKLNEQTKNLRIEIRELRTERDELNGKVRDLKLLREKTTSEIHKRISETKNLSQKIKAFAKKRPLTKLQTLQKEIEEIEWEIQTTPLSLEEEKELVDKVRHLETQVGIHKKLGMLHQKMFELQTEVRTMETSNKSIHEKLIQTAQKSQEVHNKMLDKTNKLRELEKEADIMHQEFLEAKIRTKPIQKEITETLNNIKLLRAEIRKKEEEERKEVEEDLKKKIREEAKEKLKRGGKLTWAEFQILEEKEKKTQD